MDFLGLAEALKPMGFRMGWANAPFELVRWADEPATRVALSGTGRAEVTRGFEALFRGTFQEVATWLKNRSMR